MMEIAITPGDTKEVYDVYLDCQHCRHLAWMLFCLFVFVFCSFCIVPCLVLKFDVVYTLILTVESLPGYPLPSPTLFWTGENFSTHGGSLVTNNMAAISNGRRYFGKFRRKAFLLLQTKTLTTATQSTSQYCTNLVR